MSTNTILATTPLVSTNYLLRATGTTIGNSLIWDNGTNVGIGNTNTSYTLDVSGSGRYNGSYAGHLLNVQNTNASYYSSTDYYDNAGTEKLIVGYGNASTGNALASKAIIYGTSGVGLNFYTNGSTTAKMVIDTSGNVGIGTSSPSYQLDVYAASGYTARFNGATYGGLILANAGTANSYFVGESTLLSIEHTTAINIRTNNADRMRITSGGRGLFGTTTPSAGSNGFGTSSFTVNNEVVSVGTLAGFFWENRSGGVTTGSNWYGWYTTSGTIYLYNGASNIASINTSSGAYTALSDKNKKKDFEDSTIGLNAILGLKPTLYRMNDEDENTEKHLGFIAQEVKKFIPQAYVETIGENENFIGLDDRPIIAALVKAVQEQNQTIQELSNRLNKLESK